MELIEKSEKYVREIFESKLPPGMSFHNIDHTFRVVKAIEIITDELLINEWDKQILLAAGWFHDIGYCYTYEGHEAIGMTIAGDFLRGEKCGEMFIRAVNDCIRATKMPQMPASRLHGVICDADMYHLALPCYQQYATQLRSEWMVHLNKSYSDEDWHTLNLKHMAGHHYYTEFAKRNWSRGKAKNIEKIKELLT